MIAAGDKRHGPLAPERLLARGRHCDVFATTDGAHVVRVLRADACNDESGRRGVATWGRAAMALSHPALVRVVDTVRHDGTPQVTCATADGIDANTLCTTPFAPEAVAALAVSVLRVMAYLHTTRAPDGGVWTLGKVLPAGVRITHAGGVWVLDPGIAHNALATTRASARIVDDLKSVCTWLTATWPAPPDGVRLWLARLGSVDPSARFMDAGDALTALRGALEREGVRPDVHALAAHVAAVAPTGRGRAERAHAHDPTRLDGTPYRLGARLGAGGMGEVYAAHHLDLGREAALKILYPEQRDDGPVVKRFRAEARMIASLDHPNLVRVTDFGATADGRLFYAMDRLDGDTLRRTLQGRGRLPLAEVMTLATDVCSGLEAAHRQGLVHRDVKPENLFVCRDGRIVVLDFGIAKALRPAAVGLDGAPITGVGEVYGTPGYIAPEQACGLAVDARSDVYAFGAVLYECLAGVPAFPRGTVQRLAPPVPIAVRVPQARVPPAVDALVLQCLALRPEDRPSSMADLAVRLHRALRRPERVVRAVATALLVTASIAWAVLRTLH